MFRRFDHKNRSEKRGVKRQKKRFVLPMATLKEIDFSGFRGWEFRRNGRRTLGDMQKSTQILKIALVIFTRNFRLPAPNSKHQKAFRWVKFANVSRF